MEYPQLTGPQVEIWLNDPATKTLLQCFKWYVSDIQDEVNSGSFVDRTNNDTTCNNFHAMQGRKEAFELSGDAVSVLTRYAMIEEAKDDND